MSRKLPADAQKIFDKYTVNFVRRLPREKALEMFMKDFDLDEETADFMFKNFVAEGATVLTANDFNNFYTCFGKEANCYMGQYKELETKGGGSADISGLFDFLKSLNTLSGRNPTDEELETFIKGIAGDDKTVNKTKFANLVKRVKMTRS